VHDEQAGSGAAGNAAEAQQAAPLPADYPRGFQRLLTPDDSRKVLIKPILPSDAAGLGEAIKAGSHVSARQRTPQREI
jgi:hypothetical protein